jgi:glucose-specific phosphotransferase system IIA component
MDYRKCALELYHTVGERANLVTATHCATRLRLVTKNNNQVDKKAMEHIEGVKGVFSSNGQLQIIVDASAVKSLYDEFMMISGMTPEGEELVQNRRNRPRGLGRLFAAVVSLLSAKDKKTEEEIKLIPEAENFKAEPGVIYAPVEGTIIPRVSIPDDIFACGALGDGVGIESTGKVKTAAAPIDGTVSTIASTKHAIGILSEDGIEVLVHVGIDTVSMEGKGFKVHVQEGQKVKAGQPLVTFSAKEIQLAGHNPLVIVLVCNDQNFPDLDVMKSGSANLLEPIMKWK